MNVLSFNIILSDLPILLAPWSFEAHPVNFGERNGLFVTKVDSTGDLSVRVAQEIPYNKLESYDGNISLMEANRLYIAFVFVGDYLEMKNLRVEFLLSEGILISECYRNGSYFVCLLVHS